MMQYGFLRLALLNSAGYRRAELPLDAAVSLIAPNNTGKTSLINALQFILIIDKRRMDFGAHDFETSRRFYFPHNSAYILLEVALPATGTVVLGCVGKGVSYDYEYFAYKGPLQLEDFRLPDGMLVKQSQLKSHMAEKGRLVFSYTPGEFAEALYGSRKKRQEHEPDFTVFKLEHPSQSDAFKLVLTRTLRLDKLRSNEVKNYLLEIFRRDLPDSTIDFKAEWEKAFSEVNADRAQYDAAFRQKAGIDQLETWHQQRKILRGKILAFRPVINAQLDQWDSYFQDRNRDLSRQIHDLEEDASKLQSKDRERLTRQLKINADLATLKADEERHQALKVEFALVTDRGLLESGLKDARQRLEEQTALVQQASVRGLDAIRNDQQATLREQQQLERELSTLSDNLYLRLKETLPPEQVDRLNRLLSAQTMTLAPEAFEMTEAPLRDWLRNAEESTPGHLSLPGLTVSLATLAPQHVQRTPSEVRQRLEELKQLSESLKRQLEAANAMDQARALKRQLEVAVANAQQALERYDALQALNANEAQRAAQTAALEASRDEVQKELENAEKEAKTLGRNIQDLVQQRTDLQQKNDEIVRRRGNRRDDGGAFNYLADLEHQPWLGTIDIPLDKLASSLESYQYDCAQLLRLNESIKAKVAELHAGGLIKFQFSGNDETEIKRIIEFAAHLAQESAALERKARSAVVNVTACLRELRDGLLTFKSKMREFNRLINRRQLSDLSVFKIEPVDESELVQAMELLIGAAEQAESGETFELFNHASILEDDILNRAKTLLIHEGEARGCLRVEHFFRLEFIVGKDGRDEESFSDMDSAASNGTVLMAKLVTGLALLHLMQDKRYNCQAICYLDEASALDQRNQLSLIETAEDFGFALIFASPAPLVTARYCVPITTVGGYNLISRQNWQIIEPLDAVGAEA